MSSETKNPIITAETVGTLDSKQYDMDEEAKLSAPELKILLHDHEKRHHNKVFEPIEIGPRPFADPAPLGLAGFGITCFMWNLSYIGLYQFDMTVISLGLIPSFFSLNRPSINHLFLFANLKKKKALFYGGFTQIVAGFMEYKKNNAFAMSQFIMFGFFFLILTGTQIAQDVIPTFATKYPATPVSMGYFFAMWAIIAAFMLLASLRLKGPHMLQIIHLFLLILFILLSIGSFTSANWVMVLGGVVGAFDGICAIYMAVAEVINNVWGTTMLPIFIPLYDLPKLLSLSGKIKQELQGKGKEH